MVHSKDSVDTITLLEKVGDNDYLVKTNEGIVCHAIFNIFTGLYYADDLYAKVEN